MARQTDLTRRAIIYYEEKGLLRASKSENGYREYSPEDVRILKEISAYRKLGIGIKDIRTLLSGGGREVLLEIYENKKAQLSSDQKELEALERFLKDRDADTLYHAVDYDTIAQAMQDMLPGFYGYFSSIIFFPISRSPSPPGSSRKPMKGSSLSGILFRSVFRFRSESSVICPSVFLPGSNRTQPDRWKRSFSGIPACQNKSMKY